MSAVPIYKLINDEYRVDFQAISIIFKKAKNNLVAVYSMSGPLHIDDSFMFSFFLKYLKSKGHEDWVTGNLKLRCTPQEYRERDTAKIWIWSEPFLIKKNDGTEVSIFLIYTQGCFDGKTYLKENSEVFVLSTLLSSVIIFDIKEQISENRLQILQFIVEFARLAVVENNNQPLQKIIILNPFSVSVTYDEKTSSIGKNFQNICFNSHDDYPIEVFYGMIISLFQDVSFYNMPNIEPQFSNIHPYFFHILQKFVSDVLNDEAILPKKSRESYVTGNHLIMLVGRWSTLFKSKAALESEFVFNDIAGLRNEIDTITAIEDNKRLVQVINNLKIEIEAARHLLDEKQQKEQRQEAVNRVGFDNINQIYPSKINHALSKPEYEPMENKHDKKVDKIFNGLKKKFIQPIVQKMKRSQKNVEPLEPNLSRNSSSTPFGINKLIRFSLSKSSNLSKERNCNVDFTNTAKVKYNNIGLCYHCYKDCNVNDIVLVKRCLHTFCKECFIEAVLNTDEKQVRCPFVPYDSSDYCYVRLYSLEIRDNIPSFIYERYKLRFGLYDSGNAIEDDSNQTEHSKSPLLEYLHETDNVEYISNSKPFMCSLCWKNRKIGDGLVIRDCLHTFCRKCLVKLVIGCEQPKVKCPNQEYDCCNFLQDREVKGILGEGLQFQKYLKRNVLINQVFSFSRIHFFPFRKTLPRKEFHKLLEIDDLDYVPNTEEFECPICFTNITIGMGITLRDCLHKFCKECLSETVRHCQDPQVKCPFTNDEYSCESFLQDREVKAVVSKKLFDSYLQRGIGVAEANIERTFHCKTPNCEVWCEYDVGVETFFCKKCKKQNCLKCGVIHEGQTCDEYKRHLMKPIIDMQNLKKTEEYLVNLQREGKAMKCSQCDTIVMKTDESCDFLICPKCKTELCWATKGRRWGLGGHGDKSGGCGCEILTRKCHPSCTGCH